MKRLLLLALLLAGTLGAHAQHALIVKAPGYFLGDMFVVQPKPQRMKLTHRFFVQNDSATAVLSVAPGDTPQETRFGLADGRLVRVFLKQRLVLVSNGVKTLVYRDCTFDVLN